MVDIVDIEARKRLVFALEVVLQLRRGVDQYSLRTSLPHEVLIYGLIVTKVHFFEAGHHLCFTLCIGQSVIEDLEA